MTGGPIVNSTLKVGLSEVNFHTQVFGALADLGLNVSQSRVTVYIRFTFSQQVQIRAIKKQNLHTPWARLTRIFFSVELISCEFGSTLACRTIARRTAARRKGWPAGRSSSEAREAKG